MQDFSKIDTGQFPDIDKSVDLGVSPYPLFGLLPLFILWRGDNTTDDEQMVSSDDSSSSG